ncbi:hypothetical protein F5Y16DRAFT_407782 [Xylariaceae sp. FL0255]|nr:hypothetical protein F5Y16DRAFT_407782 [Xylariaceae sp. FL0255]
MEYPSDNVGISNSDTTRVFTYGPGISCIVKVSPWEFTDKSSWQTPLEVPKPRTNSSVRITLSIITRRTGSVLATPGFDAYASLPQDPGIISNNDREKEDDRRHDPRTDQREAVESGGQRATRRLPFSRDVFQEVSAALYTHGSVSPVMSRADVPVFSYDEVIMNDSNGDGQKAWVYNCRSTNAWGGDLVMTATHFPSHNLTFGILFGCTHSQEAYIIRRLHIAYRDSSHPLLLSGIFAEIERKRQHEVFESRISDLELAMPDGSIGSMDTEHLEVNERKKKAAFLEVLYIKYGLESWKTQLAKMIKHSQSLEAIYSDPACHLLRRWRDRSRSKTSDQEEKGWKLISRRLFTIFDEYSDKIRECQMRFEGITMTTQIFQNETNIRLALATNKDSRHMKIISFVTLLFLPGTFFATVFSMTFFNWQPQDGETMVSSSVWIYVVFSVAATAALLSLWYYVILLRPKIAKKRLFIEGGNMV